MDKGSLDDFLTRRSFLLAIGTALLGGALGGCVTSRTTAKPDLSNLPTRPISVPPPTRPVARRISLRQLEGQVKLASSSPPLPLGITEVRGFEWDSQKKELWIVGDFDPSAPSILVDHFVGALRATQTQQDPGMTLLPRNLTDPESPHKVVVFPENLGIEDSRYIAALIDADYLIKAMAVSAVDTAFNFDDVVSRYHRAIKRCSSPGVSSNGVIHARVWFVPAKPVLRAEHSNDVHRIWIDKADVILESEDVFLHPDGSTVNRSAYSPVREFAREFTARFEEVKRLRVFWELQNMFKLGLLAELLHRLGLPPNRNFWLSEYLLKPYPTPRELSGFKPKTIRHNCWGGTYEYSATKTVIQIWGGVLIAYKQYLSASGQGETAIPPDFRASMTSILRNFSVSPPFGGEYRLPGSIGQSLSTFYQPPRIPRCTKTCVPSGFSGMPVCTQICWP